MAGLVHAATVIDGVATLDPAWNIWGPAGGYIAAIALDAVRAHAEPGHRPLTLTGQFLHVAKPGSVDVAVAPLKSGKTALYAVSLTQDGQPVFNAQLWTSVRYDRSLPTTPVMPDVPLPAQLRSLDDLMRERDIAPVPFWQNLESRPVNFRLASDAHAEDPRQYRWMRFRDWETATDPFREAMRQVLLTDIGIWPAHWHRQTERGGYSAPSLDLWVQFHDPRPAGDWLLSEADADVSGHGTISGRVRIWSEDGRALATGGGQCLVMIPLA